MAKKKNDAEKLNMALSLHYLHGLSNKQITRITGLHYKTVESYLAKLERQLASGELSADDIMASAESANKRLGIEALIAEDGGKDMEPEKGKENKEFAEIDKEEATIDCELPDYYQDSFGKLMDTRCIRPDDTFINSTISKSAPYPIVVLQDLIDRINNKQIAITCLSISEDDFGMLSINWRPANESK